MRYFKLRTEFKGEERGRIVTNLERLREQLDRDIPEKDTEENLLLATWNVRDLGKRNRRGYGPRLKETHYYLAEVLSRFDFVAVQEVNELPEWERIVDILGPDWDYLATDVSHDQLGGNGERLTYVFDRRKVKFCKIAGEIVLPPDLLISKAELEIQGEKVLAGKQFRRSPFMASFQSGWFKFDICTVHLYYGEASGPKLQERIDEIRSVARYLGEVADISLRKELRALILLGDFNIVHPEHETMKALVDNGFAIPKTLVRPTNINRTKYYDQIAFKADPAILDHVDSAQAKNSGVFEIFESIFRDEDLEQYAQAAAGTSKGKNKQGEALAAYYADWKTYQLSDHKPMWVRLKTNDSQTYLERLREEE